MHYRLRERMGIPVILPSDSADVQQEKADAVKPWILAAVKAVRAPPLQVIRTALLQYERTTTKYWRGSVPARAT